MKKRILGTALVLAIMAMGCQSKSNKQVKKSAETATDSAAIAQSFKDWHTQANPHQVHPDHLSLAIAVDFDKHQISGSATWDLSPEKGAEFAVFDTYKLTIDSVQYGDGSAAKYSLGKMDSILGQALKIAITPQTKQVKIFYKTSPSATALQWMAPSQTFGKEDPYLYTQGETIYTRTWVPSPDSPGFRFTYDATVKVPKGLMALMSAENPQQLSADGVYHFKMEQKIPAYLMALAVGNIAFKAVDERTGVYAEPAILDKAAAELEDIDKMVDVAESLYGNYRWGRYDVLILPSGFPIGGMENPRLTFATPTILAGDKSLVNLIAHELAHSWSGNLVTNATWNDFWLNEGFTVYFENRIMEAMNGKDYAAMLWDLSEHTLHSEMELLGKDSRHTWLIEDLKGKDPAEGFTSIPYEKGAALLLKIEQTVGREKWDEFVTTYFNSHAFETMTTVKFLDYLNTHLLDGHPDWKKAINIDQWVYAPGIPANFPEVPNPRFEKVDAQVAAYTSGTNPADLQTEGWTTYEWLRFLHELPQDLTAEQMKALDAAYHFTDTGNSEIADVWYLCALQTKYTPAYANMKKFLYVTGREKFLQPLYREMIKTPEGQQMADAIYKIARPNYHPLTQKTIDNLLKK